MTDQQPAPLTFEEKAARMYGKTTPSTDRNGLTNGRVMPGPRHQEPPNPDSLVKQPVEDLAHKLYPDHAPAKVEERKAAEEQEALTAGYSNLQLPQGMTLEHETAREALPILKELGAKPEQAQKLVSAAAKLVAKTETALMGEFKATVASWEKATRNDPELGGARLPQTVAAAKRAIDRGAIDAAHAARVRKVLNETGVGNHPDIVRLFARLGARF